MESQADVWKKFPLALVGQAPSKIPGALTVAAEELPAFARAHLNHFYFLAAGPGLVNALAHLAEAGIPAVQIIVERTAEDPLPHPELAYLGSFVAIPLESEEDARIRLLGRLELQRQKQLPYAMEMERPGILLRAENERARILRLDSTRLAHALALQFALPPAFHAQALRRVLHYAGQPAAPWPAQISAEDIVVESAVLVMASLDKGLPAREAIKETAAALPFRARSELLHLLEGILAPIVGAKHVA